MAEIFLRGKRLAELKVTELKEELDKRGLPKKGVKNILITRLKNAILKEELESAADNNVDDDDQPEVDTTDNSSQVDESIEVAPITERILPEIKSPTPDKSVQLSTNESPTVEDSEEPLASTPTTVATTDTELANQQLDDQSHDTPATLPSDGAQESSASLEGRGTPVMDESHDSRAKSLDPGAVDFIPLGNLDDSEGSVEGDSRDESQQDMDNVAMETEQNNEKEQAPANEEKGRRESVVIDPSFQPEGEELLYEGDMDVDELKTNQTEAKDDTQGEVKGQESEETKEEGFIVHLHDTSMELEFSGNKSSAQKAPNKSSEQGQSSTSEKPLVKESSKTSEVSSECHLWVSGLVPTVRALDLQTLFSPYGKVVTAKVVAKAQSRSQRFGYVTMTTGDEARRCIKELSGSELKGRTITVEVAKSPPPLSQPTPKTTPTASAHPDRRASTGNKPSPRPTIKKPTDKGSEVKRAEIKAPPIRKSLESGVRRRSPKPPQRARSHSRERVRQRGRSPPRRSPPPVVRRSSPGPPIRRSPPNSRRFRSPSPPYNRESIRNRLGARGPMSADRLGPRGPPGERLGHRGPLSAERLGPSRGNPLSGDRLGPRGGTSGDRREVAMRRDVERVRRPNEDHMIREREKEVELRRRYAHEREQEIAVRRQLEAERNRQQQEMARRVSEIREREARERQARESQLAEQERVFRERERELREREVRERQRREALEKELRDREMREREFRVREKQLKEAYERDLQAREMKAMREKEARERDARLHSEREREFRERERKLKEESERMAVAHRRYEEEQKRLREEEARVNREREETERRERERKIVEEKMAKRKLEEEQRAKREKEEKQRSAVRNAPSSGGRLGKRSYDEGGYEGNNKRPAIETMGYTGGSPASVFGRLDPLPSGKREGTTTQADLYRRGNEGSQYDRYGGRYSNERGASNYQQLTTPGQSAVGSHQQTASLFGKPTLQTTPISRKPEGVGLAGVTPEVMSAAAQVLQSMNKQVGLQNLPMTNRSSPQVNVAAQLQQIAAVRGAGNLPHLQGNYDSMHSQPPYNVGQSMLHSSSSMGGGFLAGGNKKAPPENDRYNRRPGGRSNHHSMRGGMYKGGR